MSKWGAKIGAKIFCGGVLLVIMGCATTPPPTLEKPIQKEKIYSRVYDDVWSGVMRYLASTQAAIHVANKESGVAQFTQPLPAGAGLKPYLIQQSGGFGPNYGEARSHMTVTVKPEAENQTKVKLNSRIEGTAFGLWGERLYSDNALPSSGKLESEFFNGVSVEIGEKRYEWLESEQAPKQEIKPVAQESESGS